jgi:hypothetical protein
MMIFLVATHSVADVFDTIQDTNEVRIHKYNMPLRPTIDPKDPKDLSKLLLETTKIDQLLTKNINTKVHATQDQQKKALQAVFSTEIIYGKARPSYLKGINDADDIYGHCYVLEYSTLFARDCIRQMSFGDAITPEYSVYKDLYRYSGLDEFKLFEWFMEMYNTHTPGFFLRSMNVGFSSTCLVRQYGMGYPHRKEWPTTFVTDEKKVGDERKDAHTRDMKKSDTPPVLMQSIGVFPISRDNKLFDSLNNSWFEKYSHEFRKAVRYHNTVLILQFFMDEDDAFLDSYHIYGALNVGVEKVNVFMIKILSLRKGKGALTQEGIDNSMQNLCDAGAEKGYEIIQMLFSPLAPLVLTSQGMDAAVCSACEREAVNVLQLLLSPTHLIRPTSLGMDGSLLKIASQRRTRRTEAEKLHVILDAIFSPTASIAPTLQGSDNAFFAASCSPNFKYIQYFIEYTKGIRPSPTIVDQALSLLGGDSVNISLCHSAYPTLTPYIKPYLSGVAKEYEEHREHIDRLKARADEVSEAWKRAQNSKPIPWTEELSNEALRSLSGVGVKKIDPTQSL